jgi:hypothetical protein
MNKNRGLFVASMALLVLLLVGCAPVPTRLDRAYGLSYHVARRSQTLRPEAAPHLAPLQGFDGKAAKHTLDRYYVTFEKPPPPPSFVISIGDIK